MLFNFTNKPYLLMMSLSLISVCVGLISTIYLIFFMLSNIVKMNYTIFIVELVQCVIMSFLEFPNVFCCVDDCKKVQKYTQKNKIILIKSVVYFCVSVGLIILTILLNCVSINGVTAYLMVTTSGIIYFIVFYKSKGSKQQISTPDFSKSASLLKSMIEIV